MRATISTKDLAMVYHFDPGSRRNQFDESTHKIFPFYDFFCVRNKFEGQRTSCFGCGKNCPDYHGGAEFKRLWIKCVWRSSSEIEVYGDCCKHTTGQMQFRWAYQRHGQYLPVTMPPRFSEKHDYKAVFSAFLSNDLAYLGANFPQGITSLRQLEGSLSDSCGYTGRDCIYQIDKNKMTVYSSCWVVYRKLNITDVITILNDILINQNRRIIPAGTQLSLFA